MPPQTESRIAFYKVMPSGNIPHRKGPIQTIRNCLNCIRDQPNLLDKDTEAVINFMSYDDLIARKAIWFSSYQTIQYHTGQFELLKAALRDYSKKIIFIVALTNPSDIGFLRLALEHLVSESIKLNVIQPNQELNISHIDNINCAAIPSLYQSCPRGDSASELDSSLLGPSKLGELLGPVLESLSCDDAPDLDIVSVVITKDHDRKMFPGLGTVCIQVQESFSLRNYAKHAITSYLSAHLVKHIYHDISHNAAILPTQLVAFLLLHLEREDGVTFDDILSHLDWFRKSSIDTGMHLGFTGISKSVVEFGLLVLGKFVSRSGGRYVAKDILSLSSYAGPVTAIIAYHGIIARAILAEHNKANLNCTEPIFGPDISIRVPRDDVIKTSKAIAEAMEYVLPCRKPCVEIDTMISQELSKMELSGRYFTIQEPKINTSKPRWAGEADDSDEEYFQMNKDKDAFKTWISMTTNPVRLDRLNLFVNAIEHRMSLLE